MAALQAAGTAMAAVPMQLCLSSCSASSFAHRQQELGIPLKKFAQFTVVSNGLGSSRSERRCLARCALTLHEREERAHARPRGRVGRARAAQEDESSSSSAESPTSAPPPPPPPPVSNKKAAAKAEVEKGQTTAIITGVISVLLGVGYLVLLQLLDTRGVNLVPPPPEAFDP